MSVFGTLNRAYHNNKQSLSCDQGWGLDPMGKIIPTAYQGVAKITEIHRLGQGYWSGTAVIIHLENVPREQNPGENDVFYLNYESVNGYNGEFSIYSLQDGSNKKWLYFDNINPPNEGNDTISYYPSDAWLYFAPIRNGVFLMEQMRVMSHPGLPQIEGQGIYTYPHNPDITRNFVYHPATKIDGILQRTLSSNIFIQKAQLEEDAIITEIWLGGGNRLSGLSEMFHTFHSYWTTIPTIGEALGWEPRDRTTDRFLVQIVRVQLGGLDYEYHEVRQYKNQYQDAYLDRQLTVQFKLARRIKPPIPQITLEGR